MQGEGSREGKQGGERAWVVGAKRVGSGPRGESIVGGVSASHKGRVNEGAGGLQIGPGARRWEGGLGAERGSCCGVC